VSIFFTFCCRFDHVSFVISPLHPRTYNAVVIAVLAVKAVEKGFRSLKEEHLHDYNARKANIDAAEKAMWDEVS